VVEIDKQRGCNDRHEIHIMAVGIPSEKATSTCQLAVMINHGITATLISGSYLIIFGGYG
jgi:hypothetical protein